MENHNTLGMSIDDAARASGIGRTKLYEAIAAGDLKARKFGRKTLVLTEDLNAFLRNLPILDSAA